MANQVDSYRGAFAAAVAATDGVEALKQEFLQRLPAGMQGAGMFADTLEKFPEEELPDVCAELLATLTASCTEDDFHNWDYDHLEFIIELSNRYGFVIPRNLLNGLPEQLILLVDKRKLSKPGCE